jgi:hypothetical protein
MEIYLITDFSFNVSAIKIPEFVDDEIYAGKIIKSKFLFVRSLSYYNHSRKDLAEEIKRKINTFVADNEQQPKNRFGNKISANSWRIKTLNTRIDENRQRIAKNIKKNKLDITIDIQPYYIFFLYLHDYSCVKLYQELQGIMNDTNPKFRLILNLTSFMEYVRELWRYARNDLQMLNNFVNNRLDHYSGIINEMSELIKTTNFPDTEIIQDCEREIIINNEDRTSHSYNYETLCEKLLEVPLSATISYNKRNFLPDASSIDTEKFDNNSVLYCSNLTATENIALYENFILDAPLHKIDSKTIAEIKDDIEEENKTWRSTGIPRIPDIRESVHFVL